MIDVSLKSYFKPTPVNIRKFADALLGTALFLLTMPDLFGSIPTRYFAISVIVAKFLSNFFSTEPTNPDGQAQ